MGVDLLDSIRENLNIIEEELTKRKAVQFIETNKIKPGIGQSCWVKTDKGATYRMVYPFDHVKYPLWYPLPEK